MKDNKNSMDAFKGLKNLIYILLAVFVIYIVFNEIKGCAGRNERNRTNDKVDSVIDRIDRQSEDLKSLNQILGIKQDSLDNVTKERNKLSQIRDSLNKRIKTALKEIDRLQYKINNLSLEPEEFSILKDSLSVTMDKIDSLKRSIEKTYKPEITKLKSDIEKKDSLLAVYEEKFKKILFVISVSTPLSYDDPLDGKDDVTKSDKAKRVKEIKVEFQFNRELNENDTISATLNLDNRRIQESERITYKKDKATVYFNFNKGSLKKGIYMVNLFYKNENRKIGVAQKALK